MATSAMALSFMPPFFSIFEVWACLLLVGTIVFFFWRPYAPKPVVVVKPAMVVEEDVEEDSRVKRVMVFFGTQTGTAEGFAKAIAEEAKSRYEGTAVFKVMDPDDYGADNERYAARLKNEHQAQQGPNPLPLTCPYFVEDHSWNDPAQDKEGSCCS